MMAFRGILALALIAFCFSGAPPARAQTNAVNLKNCLSPDANIRLRGCTNIIDGNGFGSKLDLVNAFDGRCHAYHSLAKFDAAIVDCKKAIALKPTHSFAYTNLATAYIGLGDFANALTAVNRSIELNSKFVWAYTKRGYIFSMLGKPALAAADYKKALELDPNNGEAQGGLNSIEAAARPQIVAAAAPSAAFASPSSTIAKLPEIGSNKTERRIALIIGNSAYTNFTRIPNPKNDAEDLSQSLKALGFEIILGIDVKRSEMEDLLISFGRKARQSDIALVFYAGHGLQYQGINYLAPTDAKLTDEADLRKFINLQDVLNDLQGASRVRILIVDACRDNTALQQLANSLPKSRSSGLTRGLAKIEADGTLVAFATQANRTADDGQGRNSPFTSSMLRRIAEPGVELRTMMTRVRSDVVAATNGSQRPEVWDSLVGEFVFAAAR